MSDVLHCDACGVPDSDMPAPDFFFRGLCAPCQHRAERRLMSVCDVCGARQQTDAEVNNDLRFRFERLEPDMQRNLLRDLRPEQAAALLDLYPPGRIAALFDGDAG